MNKKKSQHYVPQFYLRNFSIGEDRRQISLYNIPNNRLIGNVSLKNQAAKDYFYGRDEVLEEEFSHLEGLSSGIIRKIISSAFFPPVWENEHYLLVLFILTLRARTVYAAEEQAEMTDKLIKKILKNFDCSEDLINSIGVEYQHPTSVSLYAAAKAHFLAMDLQYKIIQNCTGIPFLTSDNPVVYYNQFLETRKHSGCNIGIATKGLQIFLPLSPKVMIVFYDKQVYRLGSDKKRVIDLIRSDDIDTLNGLQYLNAQTNLYFDNTINLSMLDTIRSKFNKFLREIKASVDEYPDKDNKNGVLLHLYSKEVRCRLNLSFINISRGAKKYKLGNKVMHIRNEHLYEIQRGFEKSVEDGSYDSKEFGKYLHDFYASKGLFMSEEKT